MEWCVNIYIHACKINSLLITSYTGSSFLVLHTKCFSKDNSKQEVFFTMGSIFAVLLMSLLLLGPEPSFAGHESEFTAS